MSAASLATSVPVIPMATANVGALDRRGVVDPVAGHGHDLPQGFEGVHDAHLVLR